VLVYAFHHAIADGWSLLRFNRALREGYVAGPPAARPRCARAPTWLTREQERLARHGDADRAYWRARLAAAPGVLALPADRPYPAMPSYRRASCARTVPTPLTAALESAARAGHGTVFMHLLAALNLLLHQLTGARDLLVAIPVAGRDDPALDDVLACLVNTVLVRTAVGEGDTPAAVLDRVRAATLEALDHAALPFEQVVQEVRPRPRPTLAPAEPGAVQPPAPRRRRYPRPRPVPGAGVAGGCRDPLRPRALRAPAGRGPAPAPGLQHRSL
jgi:hypothetical protein